MMKLTMPASRTNASATFTPKGFVVSTRIFSISPFTASSSPEDVSIMPMPPAFDTAEASCDRAIQPMGA